MTQVLTLTPNLNNTPARLTTGHNLGATSMKHHQHRQHYTPEPQVSAFWAILTICAAAGVATVLILAALGVLTT